MSVVLWKIFNDDKGASMVEYSLLVVLIAIVAFIAVEFAGSALSETIFRDWVRSGKSRVVILMIPKTHCLKGYLG